MLRRVGLDPGFLKYTYSARFPIRVLGQGDQETAKQILGVRHRGGSEERFAEHKNTHPRDGNNKREMS